MKCVRCHQDNPSHAKFCLDCGTPCTSMHETGPRGPSYADLQHALTESLEQQTATADILRVIASSPTDLQPVMDAVARNASRLCGAANVSLYRVEGSLMRKVAEQGRPLAALRVGETRPGTRPTVSGRGSLDRRGSPLPGP